MADPIDIAALRAELRELTDDELAHRMNHEPDAVVRSHVVGERVRRDRIPNLRRTCGVPTLWRGKVLHSIEARRGQPGALNVLLRLEPGQKGLYLYGPAGHGKSYLTACWVQTQVERGYAAKWLRWMDLLRYLRDGMSTRRGEEQSGPDLMEWARTSPALVLDDLGAGGRTSSWAVGVAEEVMDVRIGEGLTTVVTSNLWPAGNPDRIATLTGVMSARVASRMAELCRGYRLQGDDQRMRGTG